MHAQPQKQHYSDKGSPSRAAYLQTPQSGAGCAGIARARRRGHLAKSARPWRCTAARARGANLAAAHAGRRPIWTPEGSAPSRFASALTFTASHSSIQQVCKVRDTLGERAGHLPISTRASTMNHRWSVEATVLHDARFSRSHWCSPSPPCLWCPTRPLLHLG